jgi:hypothetical protein
VPPPLPVLPPTADELPDIDEPSNRGPYNPQSYPFSCRSLKCRHVSCSRRRPLAAVTVSRARNTGAPRTAQPRRGPGVPRPARVHAHQAVGHKAEPCPCLTALDRRSSSHLATPHRRVAALDCHVLPSVSSSPANGKRLCLCPFPSPAIVISPYPTTLCRRPAPALWLWSTRRPRTGAHTCQFQSCLPHHGLTVCGHHPSTTTTSRSCHGQASAAFRRTPLGHTQVHPPPLTLDSHTRSHRTGSGRCHTRSGEPLTGGPCLSTCVSREREKLTCGAEL